MSLTRAFLNDLRPLFRILEEPMGYSGRIRPAFGMRPFDHPFFRDGGIQPTVDLSEEGNSYVLEAELPGVKKENIEVKIGDNGQSVTIAGKVLSRSQPAEAAADAPKTAEQSTEANQLTATPLSTERNWGSSSSFTRTLWLPREVDESKVSAKLTDGILTLRLPKAEDKGAFKINVE